MKILNINKFHYIKGGSETYYFGLQRILERHGHCVIPFAMRDEKNFATGYSRYFVENIDYTTGNLLKKGANAVKVIYSVEARGKIAELLDSERPDIAHLHIFQHQLSPSILPQIKKRNIPVVYTVHDYKPLCPNYKMLSHGRVCERCKGGKYYHCFLNRCSKDSSLASLVNTVEMYFHKLRRYYDLIDIFIAPSEFLRGKMLEHGFPREKVIHIPNFVDADELTPAYLESDYFVYFGRLSEEKGILTLVKATGLIQKGRLCIVGSGPLEDEVKEAVRAAGITSIELAGFKSGRALADIIKGAAFTVLPSEWYENNPLAALESFAHGKAVIGSRIGGIPELISDGVTGLTFDPGDHRDLAHKIDYLFAETGAARQMGKNARRKVEEVYNAEHHYGRIKEVYERLV